MKKVLLFTFLCMIAYRGLPQWTSLSSGTSNDLKSVFFTNTNTGYTVGSYGIILKTVNGGSTWTESSVGLNTHLNSVFFTDPNTGYAVGKNLQNNGVIYKTTDAGISWTILTNTISNVLNAVYFPTANIGFAVGPDGLIIKTTDFGLTWITLPGGTTQTLNGVHFPSVTTGYVVGLNGTILKTTNGGATWNVLSVNTSDHLRSVSFNNQTKGCICGDNGTMLTTSNGGITWNLVNIYANSNQLNSVYCLPSSTSAMYIAYSVGSTGKFFTGLLAEDWLAYPTSASQTLTSVFFCNYDTGYIVGASGVIFKTTVGGNFFVGTDELSQRNQKLEIYPNPSSSVMTIDMKNSSNTPVTIELVSLTGILMKRFDFGNLTVGRNKEQINVESLSPGIYFLTANVDGERFIQKVVITP